MQTALARTDDRLIHGQTTTVWSKVASAQRIVICNNDVFSDGVRRIPLRQVVPSDIKTNVVSLEKAVTVYHNPQYQDETIFYLSTNPHDVLTTVHQGVQIATLDIDGMVWRPGKKQLTKAVSLDPQDIQAFREPSKLGVKLDLHVVASNPLVNILDKINETVFYE